MSLDLPVLESVRVASPCSASWEAMRGDERARFCGECGKHVYNLSGMTRGEAEALIREREGDLCVRLHRRRDGMVLTRDCPVGRFRMRRMLMFQVSLITSLFLAIPGVAGALERWRWREWSLWDREPYASLAIKLGIRKEEPPTWITGDMVIP